MSGRLPLDGVRVVEFSHMIMGPSCGLVLADLGADVIKVEPMGDGDSTRNLAGSGAGFFAAFNRNKRSIQLDLKSARGMAFVRKLLASADVVTENFRPGALEVLGLGYQDLRADHPRLIYCSLKGFLSGPYEHRAALDEVVQMMGGLAYMTGPSGRPLRAGASVNDIMGGMFAVIGIQAALLERARTGEGQLVRSALFENNMYLMSTHMMQFAVTGKPAAPMPERIAAWAIYDVFDTAQGGQVFVGVVSDRQWRTFCAAFALTHLIDAPGLESNADRVRARGRFLPEVRAMFAALPSGEILERCERIGLPFAAIARPEDMFADPHLQHPGAMLDVTLADGRTAPVPALPLEMAGQRLPLRHDLPRAGEHGAQVARSIGLDDDEIAELQRSGVLGGS